VSLCLQRGVPPLGQEPQREQRLTGQVADEHEVQAERDQADVSDVLKVIDIHQRLGASLPGADRRQVPGVAEQRQPGCQRGQAPVDSVDWCEERRLSVHKPVDGLCRTTLTFCARRGMLGISSQGLSLNRAFTCKNAIHTLCINEHGFVHTPRRNDS